jgi:hypothetical protein
MAHDSPTEGEEFSSSKDLIVPSFENTWVKCH